ncbi:MAG: penicillin-insensitive murein endopeptidase [Polyangiales bacterium]
MALPETHSTSLGSPIDGSLQGAVALPAVGPGFRFNPRRRAVARFGAVAMVQALMHAAAEVAREHPGGELTINDLGLQHGGPIRQHGSHQSGRDVDVLFYLLGTQGQPIPSVGAPLDPRGRGVDFKDLGVARDDVRVRIDLPRTWAFVAALLQAPQATVQRIFIAEHLRALLLRQAQRAGTDKRWRVRFAELTCQPGAPHDDHMHIRFFCGAHDIRAGCRDTYPVYPWWRKQLRTQGLKPVPAGPRRRQLPHALTTARAARQAAEKRPMHAKVRAWLDKREAWVKRPHPGRRYCR